MSPRRRWDAFGAALLPAPGGVSDRAAYTLIAFDLLMLVAATWASSVHLVAFAVVVAASSAGAGIGILFAIPKQGSARRNEAQGSGVGASFIANTSLEDVSYCLTKTIVGVGLI